MCVYSLMQASYLQCAVYVYLRIPVRAKSLELTAVNESVVMDNIHIFRMNGFHFEVDSTGRPGLCTCM